MLDASNESQAPETKCNSTTHYCAIVSVLTTQPWTICQNQIVTSYMVSHTWHNSEPILDGKDSQLGFLHLALAYRYIILLYGEDIKTCFCTWAAGQI